MIIDFRKERSGQRKHYDAERNKAKGATTRRHRNVGHAGTGESRVDGQLGVAARRSIPTDGVAPAASARFVPKALRETIGPLEGQVGIGFAMHPRRQSQLVALANHRVSQACEFLPHPHAVLRWTPDDLVVREVLDVDDGNGEEGPLELTGTDLAEATAALDVPQSDRDRRQLCVESHELAVGTMRSEDAVACRSDSFDEDPCASLPDLSYPLLLVRVRAYAATCAAVHAAIASIVATSHAEHRARWLLARRQADETKRRPSNGQAYPYEMPQVHVLTSVAHGFDCVTEFAVAVRGARTQTLHHLNGLTGKLSLTRSFSQFDITSVDIAADPVEDVVPDGALLSAAPQLASAEVLSTPAITPPSAAGVSRPALTTTDTEPTTDRISVSARDDDVGDVQEANGHGEVQLPLWQATEYELLLRSEADSGVGGIVTQFDKCRATGFVNYTSTLRHGLPTTASFAFAKHLLRGNFDVCVTKYASNLGSMDAAIGNELGSVNRRLLEATHRSNDSSDAAARQRNLTREMRDSCTFVGDRIASMKKALPAYSSTRHLLPGSELSLLEDLRHFLKSAAESGGDALRILDELVPERVLRDHLRTASDVQFNSLATMRLRRFGAKVVPGDVVCLDRGLLWDAAEPPLFAPPSDRLTEPPASDAETIELNDRTTETLHVVRSETEAAQFDLLDVVLPKMGVLQPLAERVLEMEGTVPSSFHRRAAEVTADECREAMQAVFPELPNAGTVNIKTMAALSQELGLSALFCHPLAPPPTYRRLIAKPESLLACGWDDRLEVALGDTLRGSGEVSRGAAPPTMAVTTDVDREGVRRLRFAWPPHGRSDRPASQPSGSVVLHRFATPQARPVIREREARDAFLATARKSACIGVRTRLPAGVALTSLLRECVTLSLVRQRDVTRLALATGEQRIRDLERRKEKHERRQAKHADAAWKQQFD
jgi:hypothetical protein